MRKNLPCFLLILAFLTATALMTAGCHHRGWGHSAGFYYGSPAPSTHYAPETYYSTYHAHTTALIRPGPIMQHPAPHPSHIVKPAPGPDRAGKPGMRPVPGPKPGQSGNIHTRPGKHAGSQQTNLSRPGNRTSRPTLSAHPERSSGPRPPAQTSFSPEKHRDSPKSPAPGKRGEKRRS